jgi:EAL domain-containing protein (putative c-di-GMP-specific phosphodiesterase class I)
VRPVKLLLDRILEDGGLSVVFQPVVEVTPGGLLLHGLECLARGPRGTNAQRADVMFEYVRRKHQEPVVDRACIRVALKEASRLPGAPTLSLNVHASTVGRDPEFPAFFIDAAERHGVHPSRLIIEIVEHTQHWDGVTFERGLCALREAGARIALDDVGLGHSNYRMMLDTRPEYLKIDRYFVHGAQDDRDRRVVLDSIAQLALKLGARAVGEGVEDSTDLVPLREFGIDLVQGNLFDRPLTTDELRAHGWLGQHPATSQPRTAA